MERCHKLLPPIRGWGENILGFAGHIWTLSSILLCIFTTLKKYKNCGSRAQKQGGFSFNCSHWPLALFYLSQIFSKPHRREMNEITPISQMRTLRLRKLKQLAMIMNSEHSSPGLPGKRKLGTFPITCDTTFLKPLFKM